MCGFGFEALADSALCTFIFTLSFVLGLPTFIVCSTRWGFGLATVLLCMCILGLSVGVCFVFGEFSFCSPLLFTADILLFCCDGSSFSLGDITEVVRLPADLSVSVVAIFAPSFPAPLFPSSLLFPPCSFEVSADGRGFLGEERLRLRLKSGSAHKLVLGPGIGLSDWTTSFSH